MPSTYSLESVNGLFIAQMMGLSALAGSFATYLAVTHPFNSAQHTQTNTVEHPLNRAQTDSTKTDSTKTDSTKSDSTENAHRVADSDYIDLQRDVPIMQTDYEQSMQNIPEEKAFHRGLVVGKLQGLFMAQQAYHHGFALGKAQWMKKHAHGDGGTPVPNRTLPLPAAHVPWKGHQSHSHQEHQALLDAQKHHPHVSPNKTNIPDDELEDSLISDWHTLSLK